MESDGKAVALLRDEFSDVINALSLGERRCNGRIPKRTKKVLSLIDKALGWRLERDGNKNWQKMVEEELCNA